jgi:hypothetical protein
MQSQNKKPIRNRGEERMNRRNLFLKTYTAFLTVMMITGFSLQQPVVESSTPPIDGSLSSFGYNNPATISGVKILYRSGVVLGNDVELERLDDFIIEFDVFDIDGFTHLDVYVALYNNNSATANTDSGLLDVVINSGVNDNALVFRWIAPERSVYLSGLAETDPFDFSFESGVSSFLVKSGTTPVVVDSFNSGIEDFVSTSEFNARTDLTWEVTTSGLNTASGLVIQSGTVNTFSGTTVIASGTRNIGYRVQVPFKMSKVAPSSGVWNLGVVVYDRLQQEIDAPRTDLIEIQHQWATRAFDNQWYGEVNVLTNSGANTVIRFTDVQAGSGAFQTSDSGVTVRFTSNGTYNQQVQADTTWNPAQTFPNRVEFAFLVPSSGLSNGVDFDDAGVQQGRLDSEGNRFALQARRLSNDGDGVIKDYEDIVITGSTLIPPIDNDEIYRQSVVQGEPNNTAIGSLIRTIDSASGTDEEGILAEFDFALKLSPVFQNTAYSGGITIGISNDFGFFNSSTGTFVTTP